MLTTTQKESLTPPLWIVVLLLIGLFGWLLYELKEIVFLLVVGYCIAYLFDPLLDWLEEKKISRPIGVFLLVAVMTLGVILLTLTAVPTIVREYREFAENFPEYFAIAKEKVLPLLGIMGPYLPGDLSLEKGFSSLVESLPALEGETIQSIVSGVFATLLRGYSLTLTVVNLFLLPFIVYYLAVDFDRIHRYALGWFPMLRREKIRSAFQEIDFYVSAYVRGQLTVGFVLFVLYAVGLGVIGVELWFLLAVISGFGNLVPYLGSIVGIVLSTIMTLVTFGSFTYVLIVWGMYALVQFLEGTFVTPGIVGDKVGLSPLVVILAILAAGSLFGLLGIFLAVPAVAITRVFMKHLHIWLVARAQG